MEDVFLLLRLLRMLLGTKQFQTNKQTYALLNTGVKYYTYILLYKKVIKLLNTRVGTVTKKKPFNRVSHIVTLQTQT